MSIIGKARDNIRLRSGPTFEAPEIGFINVTKEVEIVGVEGDWLRVKWKDKEGYVARKFILVEDQDALASLANYPTPPSKAAADKAAGDTPKRAARPKTKTTEKKKDSEG